MDDKPKVPLCLPDGKLNPQAIRWDTHPFVDATLYKSWARKKRWMYWAIMSEWGVFATVITDIDYLKLGSVYFATFDNPTCIQRTQVIFTHKNIYLPTSPYENAHFKHKNISLQYTVEGNITKITADAQINRKDFYADIEIVRNMDFPTLNVVIPWSPHRFQFTSKQLPFPASGHIQYGQDSFTFDQTNTFACLDYGAGKWKYFTAWNWCSASGTNDKGQKIGINLGGLWTDGTGQNENGFWIDNQFFKLTPEVSFQWNKNDPMEPWQIKTKEKNEELALELTFEPFFKRQEKMNLLILKSEVVQCFGKFYGYVVNKRDIIKIERLLGWSEEHHARW